MRTLLALILVLALPSAAAAENSLDLGVNEVGLSFGNSPRWTGVRLNAVDEDVERLTGLNLSLWKPNGSPDGTMTGLNVGLWGPGAAHVRGVHAGIVTVEAHRRLEGIGFSLIGCAVGEMESDWGYDRRSRHSEALMRGIFVGGLGLGSAGDLQGLAVGGLGMGVGNDLTGIAIGGLGMGVGGSARGLIVGGLGAAAGEDLEGLAFAGLGFGVGGDARGVVLAGLGAGVGGNFEGLAISGAGMGIGEDFRGISVATFGMGVGGSGRGLMISGLGSGVGDDFTGLQVAGLGFGVGGTMKGIGLAGFGFGAEETRAFTAAIGTTRGYAMHGVTISAYNEWKDSMSGLSIGVVNITRELHGVQLGLINIVKNNPSGRRVLPLLNWGG